MSFMPSNLKRLLNEVDDVDYSAVEQYARHPPAPSPSPTREMREGLRSRSPSSEVTEMNVFGQDLAAYATSTGSALSRGSPASYHAAPLHALQSPVAPGVSSSEGAFDTADRTIVCYGMIHKVDVKIVGDKRLLDSRLAAAGPSAPHQVFALTELPDHIMLSFKEERPTAPPQAGGPFPPEFGYLRSHMKASLDGLLSRPDVEFEAVAPTRALRDAITGFKKSSDALVSVDVNVYGPRGLVAKTVGRMLSRNRLYLQTPDTARPGPPHENPQRVSFATRG